MNLPMQSKSHRGGFFPPWQMTRSIWRSMAKSCAPECFPLSRSNIETAHTTSGLVWPLRMAFWMGYRCYKATAFDSLQSRWTRWLWFSLTPSKTTLVLSKRLHAMPDRRLSLLINWGKEPRERLAKFPLKPPKTECVRTPIALTGGLNVSMSSSKMSISSSILTQSWKFFFSQVTNWMNFWFLTKNAMIEGIQPWLFSTEVTRHFYWFQG